MQIKVFPIFPECPTNPARCNLQTGEIEINQARFSTLTDAQKEFVLWHEIGHYKLHTFNELKADRYALEQMALKKPYSLTNYLRAISEVSNNNYERLTQAKYDTLHIAALNGSIEAQKLLKEYNAKQYANADGKNSLHDLHNNEQNNRILYLEIAVIIIVIFLSLKLYTL